MIDVGTVFQVMHAGWNDIFDAVLYSAYKTMTVSLLIMDRPFYRFLKQKGRDVSGVILL
ncbi:hypothetical protein HS7_14110 [Sulfolobales archaeon HS-7]|nr:hypothetical protein HS7_14110 [Sulfolobales archaeon HS-7]